MYTPMKTFQSMYVMRLEVQTVMQIKFPLSSGKQNHLHCCIYVQNLTQ